MQISKLIRIKSQKYKSTKAVITQSPVNKHINTKHKINKIQKLKKI